MKNFIKSILGIKVYFIGKRGVNVYIHPFSSIKKLKNIIMKDNSHISKGVTINITSGSLELKENSFISDNTRITIRDGKLELGKKSFLNNDCEVITLGDIIIGDNVLIGPKTMIISGNHNYNLIHIPINEQGYSIGRVEIEDNVWIGGNCTLLNNIKIEQGAIIGAGSVVTKSVGKNEIWAGNPAKFIKKR